MKLKSGFSDTEKPCPELNDILDSDLKLKNSVSLCKCNVIKPLPQTGLYKMNRPDSQFTLHKTTLRPLYIQPTYQSRHLPLFVVLSPYPLLLYICPSCFSLLPSSPLCSSILSMEGAFLKMSLFIFC